ncbi:MAG TPA: KH domain-containing protein [Candidatus Moranbacteria bacterium]|nr:KH domain-containing protein [Candidatus Moranbacteria bacterium]
MTEATKTDAEFIEQIVKMLVDNPDAVKVERKVDEMGVLVSLDVDPSDMGIVIGREGQTAKALRTLLRVIGAKNNARVNLKINEPEGSERAPRNEAPASDAPAEKKSIDEVVEDIEKM